MYTFIIASGHREARKLAPWGNVFRKYKDGYLVFCNKQAYKQFMNGEGNDPRRPIKK
jgi:hypothetical protein